MIEVVYISHLIRQTIEAHNPANSEEKILLCGSWCEVSPCLEYITAHMSTQSIFPHLVVATDEIDPFIDAYMGKDQIELVDWNERDYEEELIERVRNKHDTERRILLSIDFQPNPRRMLRVRYLLEADGTMVIPYEKPVWRERYGELMRSFTQCGGQLIKLSETLPSASEARQRQVALGEGYRIGTKWAASVSDSSRER